MHRALDVTRCTALAAGVAAVGWVLRRALDHELAYHRFKLKLHE